MTETSGVRQRVRFVATSTIPLILMLVLFSLANLQQTMADEAAVLEVEKSVSSTSVEPGEIITYTIQAANTTGAPIEGALLTDTLTSTLIYVSDSLTATYGSFGISNNVITWTGDLGQVLITYSAQITPSLTEGVIENTVSVTGTGTLVTDTASTSIYEETLIYFPIIFKRWPPIPYAPALQAIDNSGGQDDYTVSWTYDYTGEVSADTFILEESVNDGSFSNPTQYTIDGSTTSKAFTNKDGGTYYYRVKGENGWGVGPWSNVESTSVRKYTYNFNSSTKLMDPWPVRRTDYWHGDDSVNGPRVTWTEEHDGGMYFIMADRWNFAIASPFDAAPAPPYVIETRVKVHDPSNLVAHGVIFGGNGGSPCPAYRETGCLTHYYRLEAVWSTEEEGGLKASLKRIDYHEPEESSGRGKGRGVELMGDGNSSSEILSGGGSDWHTWRFEVYSDRIKIYHGGSLWKDIDSGYDSDFDARYIDDPYFGAYVSANEYNPSIAKYDYYKVYPIE